MRSARRTPDPFTRIAAAIDGDDHDLISTDVFDTVLLRDASTETGRFAEAARRAAPALGVDPAVLARLRWSAHDCAYGAVALERPAGEARLAAMCTAVATVLGAGPAAADALRAAEVAVDARHLRPHRRLLDLLARARARGVRVVATSDTYYGVDDLRELLACVVGPGAPLDAVYSSADEGLTKHAGGLFGEVARREGVDPARVLHMGDHPVADVERARAAGWSAIHLPRPASARVRRMAGGVRALPLLLRRAG